MEQAFFAPLFALLKGTGQNKNAVASACYCLRSLIKFLYEKKPELVTPQLTAKFTNIALKHKIVQNNFIETLREMMSYSGKGLVGIAPTTGKQMYEFSIGAIRSMMSSFEQNGGHIFGN